MKVRILYKKLGTVSRTPWIKALFSGWLGIFASKSVRSESHFPSVSKGPIARHFGVALQKCHDFTTGRTLFKHIYPVDVGWKVYKIVCNPVVYRYIVGGFQPIILWKPGCYWNVFEIATVISLACFTSPDDHVAAGAAETEWFGHRGIGLMLWLKMNHVALLKMNTYANTGRSPQDFMFTQYQQNMLITKHNTHIYCSNLWMQLAINPSHLIILWQPQSIHKEGTAWNCRCTDQDWGWSPSWDLNGAMTFSVSTWKHSATEGWSCPPRLSFLKE